MHLTIIYYSLPYQAAHYYYSYFRIPSLNQLDNIWWCNGLVPRFRHSL